MNFGKKFTLDEICDRSRIDENGIGKIDVKVQRTVRFGSVAGRQNANLAGAQRVTRERFAASKQDEGQNAVVELLPVFRFFGRFVLGIDVENKGNRSSCPAEDGVDGVVQKQIRLLDLLGGDEGDLLFARFAGVRRDAVLAVLTYDFEGREFSGHAGEGVELAGPGFALVLGRKEDVAECDAGEGFPERAVSKESRCN